MSARSLALRAQNEQIVTFTLVELLTQLVFVAMLLAIVLQDEAYEDVNPSAERLQRLEAELAQKDTRIRQLEQDNEALHEQLAQQQELVRSLLGTKGTTLPFGVVAITQEEADYYASLKRMLTAQQKATAAAKAEVAAIKGGKGGTDLPNCLITSGFLLDIKLLGDGTFAVTQSWDKGARTDSVTGLSALTAGPSIGSARFATLATQVHDWGAAQEVPCAFRVIARRRHDNANLFERQLRLVEQRFYVSRR